MTARHVELAGAAIVAAAALFLAGVVGATPPWPWWPSHACTAGLARTPVDGAERERHQIEWVPFRYDAGVYDRSQWLVTRSSLRRRWTDEGRERLPPETP